jgi:hypothetical protein
MCIGERIDNIRNNVPQIPAIDLSSVVPVDFYILVQVAVAELGLNEYFLGGQLLHPSVMNLRDVRVVRSSDSIDAMDVEGHA